VRPCNCHNIVPIRESRQQFRSSRNAHLAPTSSREFLIGFWYSRRRQYEISRRQVGGVMAYRHSNAFGSERARGGGCASVRPVDVYATTVQYPSDGRHASAADTDDVDLLYCLEIKDALRLTHADLYPSDKDNEHKRKR
jgi:hypothetical protein